MNNQLVRIGLPVAIVVALVFGVTYVSQLAPNTGPKPVAPVAAAVPRALIVPTDKASWDQNERPDVPMFARYAKEMEARSEGHYDFWLANVHDFAASIALKQKSCKCADVQLGIVPADDVAAFLAEQAPPIPGKVEPNIVEKLLAARPLLPHLD